MKYILDTNILIDSWKEHYPVSIFPAFWKGLINAVSAGDVIICESVYKEILKGNDDLKDWLIHSVPRNQIEPDSKPEVVEAYKKVINSISADTRRYTIAALQVFASVADSQLIAHALAGGYTILTLETSRTEETKKVKIPNAAFLMNVPCAKIKAIFPTLGFHI